VRRRLKRIRLNNSATGGEFKLMQTARDVKIKRDLPPGTLVYMNTHGNIKPMPPVFGMVVSPGIAEELNQGMYDKYGPKWRDYGV